MSLLQAIAPDISRMTKPLWEAEGRWQAEGPWDTEGTWEARVVHGPSAAGAHGHTIAGAFRARRITHSEGHHNDWLVELDQGDGSSRRRTRHHPRRRGWRGIGRPSADPGFGRYARRSTATSWPS